MHLFLLLPIKHPEIPFHFHHVIESILLFPDVAIKVLDVHSAHSAIAGSIAEGRGL